MKFKCSFLFPLILLSAVSRVHANVRIVPGSPNATLLRASQARLDVQINQASRMAKVTSTWVFANSASTGFESTLFAQAPSSAIMSRFSYWFRGQQVLARIVEKERAAQIYRDATAPPRRRDPALVEMLARNILKVRIAPVEAQKPLKVELVWLQPVERDAKGLYISLPWREATDTVTVEKFTLAAHFTTPIQNFTTTGAGKATANPRIWEGTGALPQNAVLRFGGGSNSSALLRSQGSGDGFFAGIVSEQAWQDRAKWNWKPFALHSRVLGSGERLVAGRFKNWLSNAGFSTTHTTDAQTWWAAFELDALAQDEKNRSRGIALSKRFGLPSKWTSWLAIPDSERERLYEIINREKVQKARREQGYLRPILQKERLTGNNPTRLKRLEAAYRAAAVVLRQKPDTAIRELYEASYVDLSYQIEEVLRQNSPKNVAKLASLRRQRDRVKSFATSKTIATHRESEQVINTRNHVEALAQKTATAFKNNKQTPQLLAQTRAATARIGNYSVVSSTLAELATAELALRSHPTRAEKVRAFMEQIRQDFARHSYGDLSNNIVESAIGQAESRAFQPRLEALNRQLAAEFIAGRETGARYAELEAQRTALLKRVTQWQGDARLPLDDAIRKTYRERERQRSQTVVDQTKVDKLSRDLERFQKQVGAQSYESTLYWERQQVFEAISNTLGNRWLEAKRVGNDDLAQTLRSRLKTFVDEENARTQSPYGVLDVDGYLRRTEYRSIYEQVGRLKADIFKERGARVVNTTHLQQLQAKLDAIIKSTFLAGDSITREVGDEEYIILSHVLENLRAEVNKDKPDGAVVADLKKRLIELQASDYYYHSYWPHEGRTVPPTKYGLVRGERIETRANIDKTLERLNNPQLSIPQRTALEAQVAKLRQLENQLRVRVGDPLIAVKAPKNALHVLATLPNGELLPLRYNATNKQWEARFDIPTHATQGDYPIQIVVVFANGTRQQLAMHLSVDLQAPSGLAAWKMDGRHLVLTLQTDEQTDRVSAFLPWGERIELRRNAQGLFQNSTTLPTNFNAQHASVRFVLTDKAHNRTEIVLDLSEPRPS